MAHIRDEVHPQPVSKKPQRKVVAGVGTSALGTPIIAWIANDVLAWDMPELVAAEIAILIGGAVSYVVRNH